MESKAHAMLVVMRLNSDRGGGGWQGLEMEA